MRTSAFLFFLLSAAAAPIEYIGRATIGGGALDKSGLTDTIAWGSGDSMPHNQLGGFGSGLAYTGGGSVFVAVNDRGPGDGAAMPYYYDRFRIFTLKPDVATKTIAFELLSTPLMVNQQGQHFNGNASDFNTVTPASTMRFDPEAVRTGRDGNYFVSDEYGPFVYQFDRNGNRIRTIQRSTSINWMASATVVGPTKSSPSTIMSFLFWNATTRRSPATVRSARRSIRST